MNIQLIEGEFSSLDAIELISSMIHVKIKYHENKITKESNEEDIKYRESKIKKLQKTLYEFRSNLNQNEKNLRIDAIIKVENSN